MRIQLKFKQTVFIAGVLLYLCSAFIIIAVCLEVLFGMWERNEQTLSLLVFMGLLILLFSTPCFMLAMKNREADKKTSLF